MPWRVPSEIITADWRRDALCQPGTGCLRTSGLEYGGGEVEGSLVRCTVSRRLSIVDILTRVPWLSQHKIYNTHSKQTLSVAKLSCGFPALAFPPYTQCMNSRRGSMCIHLVPSPDFWQDFASSTVVLLFPSVRRKRLR